MMVMMIALATYVVNFVQFGLRGVKAARQRRQSRVAMTPVGREIALIFEARLSQTPFSQSIMTTTARPTINYPFTAIVGQDEMKLCLLLNIIDPRIGGVMVMGHRGTGKSTTVRALADVLPMITRIIDDPYNRETVDDSRLTISDSTHKGDASAKSKIANHKSNLERVPVPVVDLPLGATEDRVCGTIDIEAALTQGVKRFAPGLLAKANRGFLYIDEVNLLDDHLVDVLLDVAASGWNVVEREGVSVRHPARFVLVGSGNPEEGELRPQLLDRFGMHARITTIIDVAQRVEIVKRRRDFDADPEAFLNKWEPQQKTLRSKIVKAQKTGAGSCDA